MKKSQKIIAVDFDGVLALDEYPRIGHAIQSNIDDLLSEQKKGAKLILWTCRVGAELAEAVAWCHEHSIYFDAVNQNLPEMVQRYGGDPRKICADEYWDDKAVEICPETLEEIFGNHRKELCDQLESLLDDRKSFFNNDGDDEIFRADAAALEQAIAILQQEGLGNA